jgi:hypothetical protein
MAAPATGPLTEAERAEILRFIRVLDYEKHSGAEHRAVRYLQRLFVAMEHWRERGDLLAVMKRIGYEPFGHAEASAQEVLDAITETARVAVDRAEVR